LRSTDNRSSARPACVEIVYARPAQPGWQQLTAEELWALCRQKGRARRHRPGHDSAPSTARRSGGSGIPFFAPPPHNSRGTAHNDDGLSRYGNALWKHVTGNGPPRLMLSRGRGGWNGSGRPCAASWTDSEILGVRRGACDQPIRSEHRIPSCRVPGLIANRGDGRSARASVHTGHNDHSLCARHS